MNIADYFHEYLRHVEFFSQLGVFADENIEYDHRTESVGVVRGHIVFYDGSKLSFMEFVDTKAEESKITYSYHYQDVDSIPIFRYDNALHRPSLGYRHHKHVGMSIQKSDTPSIRGILSEIADRCV
jgi:hypothetical protein